MAETEVQSYPRTITKLIEEKVEWYDGRGDPEDNLIVRQVVVYTKAEWVIRECIDCSHRFLQHWKEWNDW